MPDYDLPVTGRMHGDVGITVNPDFTLVVDCLSDIAGFPIFVQSRVVGNGGELFDSFDVITSDGLQAIQRTLLNLPSGLLTGVAAGIVGDFGAIGEVRIRVGFGTRGGGNAAPIVILDGYVGGGYGMSWPVMQPSQTTSERGKWLVLPFVGPVAGLEDTFVVPVSWYFDLVCVSDQLTTGVAVANRTVNYWLIDATTGGVTFLSDNASLQVAATAFNWIGMADHGFADRVVGTEIRGMLLRIAMSPGDTLTTSTVGLQAADVFGGLTISGYRRFEF